MTSEVTDADLLKAHVDGDPNAFGILFSRHRDRLWAVALRTAGGPDDAADALQDAMVSAFRRAGSFRGEAAVTTWLHRIVVNACLDQHRRRRNKPTTTWIETLHETAHTTDDMANREPQIEPLRNCPTISVRPSCSWTSRATASTTQRGSSAARPGP